MKRSITQKGRPKAAGWGDRVRASNSFILEIEGAQYVSAVTVAKIFGITPKAVLQRCRSTTGKFPNWRIVSMASRENK